VRWPPKERRDGFVQKEGPVTKERFQERFAELQKAFSRLEEALAVPVTDTVIMDGVIQRFEFTFELTWKTLKILLDHKGLATVAAPRDVLQGAFAAGIISDGEAFMQMLRDRNLTTHIYKEEMAAQIYDRIKNAHAAALRTLLGRLATEKIA